MIKSLIILSTKSDQNYEVILRLVGSDAKGAAFACKAKQAKAKRS